MIIECDQAESWFQVTEKVMEGSFGDIG